MSVAIVDTIAGLRRALRQHRLAGAEIGFVPTMGALHAGHARLIETARAECAVVVVSIFVNPLQFDRADDYDRYVRTLPADAALCERAGADLVFAPTVAEMYPASPATYVEVKGLTDHFCGASRPGHFRGVTTVVAKLFGIVEPERAYFGEKDAQQLAVIEQMTRDLNFRTRIVAVSTVREPDGLALSSRNARLNSSQRAVAPKLYTALTRVSALIESGECEKPQILTAGRRILEDGAIRIDYFDIADPTTVQPVHNIVGPVRAMGAIWVGDTRLIDNILCVPPHLSTISGAAPNRHRLSLCRVI